MAEYYILTADGVLHLDYRARPDGPLMTPEACNLDDTSGADIFEMDDETRGDDVVHARPCGRCFAIEATPEAVR